MIHFEIRDEYRFSRVCYIIEAALEYFVSIMMTGAFLARITSSLGFSDSLTGILSSFVSLGCLFQLGSIRVFKRFSNVKQPIIVGHIVNQLLFAFVYLTPVLDLTHGTKTVLFLICFCGAFGITNLISPTKTSWMLSLIDDRQRGIFTARKEIVSLLGGMTFTYLIGNLIDFLEAAGNQRMAFVAGACTVFVLMILHTLSMFPIKHRAVQQTNTVRSEGSFDLLRDKMFVRLVLIGVLWHIASGCAQPFYGAYQIKELGFSMTFVSILSIAYSIVRVAFSPMIGRYADKTSFAHMVSVCFAVAAAGFLVNTFTVPENGRVFYTIYHCLSAVSMAGINSAMTNLICDYIHGDARRNALAINASLGGVTGFLTTCLVSPLVAFIQENGNKIGEITVYPAQLVSALAFILTAALVVYIRLFVIRPLKKA